MTIHQYFQIDSCPAIRLSTWRRIYSTNGVKETGYKYIRIVTAWRLNGEVIYLEIPANADVIVGVEFTSK